MSKTTIKIRTWSCSNDECRYKQDFEPTSELMLKHFKTESSICPSCGQAPLKREKIKAKLMSHVVMGEEDIEGEILEIKEDEQKRTLSAAQEVEYRTRRKQDIKDAIKEARKYEDL